MKPIKRLIAAIAICALAGGATSATAALDPAYNFGYASSGEAALRPQQAFDDGNETFLQIKSDVAPAVFVVQSGESKLVATERRGPYLVIPTVGEEIVLRFGSLEARVVNKSPRSAPSGQGDLFFFPVSNQLWLYSADAGA